MDGCGLHLYLSAWRDACRYHVFLGSRKDFALTAVNKGTKKTIGSWFMPLGKYVLVPAALLALVAGALLGGIG